MIVGCIQGTKQRVGKIVMSIGPVGDYSPVVLQDVGTTGAESAPGGSMDGGLSVDGAAEPSDTEEKQAIRRVFRVMKRPWQNRLVIQVQ